MEHIAIDLGARESQVCVRSEGGRSSRSAGSRRGRRSYGAIWKGGPKSRVIVETGAEAFWVAEIARECGHEVRVVPSMLAPSLGVGQTADRRATSAMRGC